MRKFSAQYQSELAQRAPDFTNARALQSGWTQPNERWTKEELRYQMLNTLRAHHSAGVGGPSQALAEAFKVLNLERTHSGTDNYAFGHTAWTGTPTTIVLITDASDMVDNDQEVHFVACFAINRMRFSDRHSRQYTAWHGFDARAVSMGSTAVLVGVARQCRRRQCARRLRAHCRRTITHWSVVLRAQI